MTVDEAVVLAAGTLLAVLLAPAGSRLWRGVRLDRPAPQPLRVDPVSFDPDGPVLDLEPA